MSLHLYSPLSSNDEPTRLSAAHSLSSELLTLLSGPSTPQTKSSVDYALSRLTKGLSSGRDSARPGFATVLTELLPHFLSPKWSISLPSILSTILKHTTTPSHGTGPEERDYSLGRLFGLQALIQSHVLRQNPTVHNEVVVALWELSRRKPWLAESCAWVLVEAVKTCGEGEAAEVYKALVDSGMARSSEGVAVWLALRAYHPGVVPGEEVWVPLEGGSLVGLGRSLKEEEKGCWSAKVHFVWDFVLAVYFDGEGVWAGVRGGCEVAGWEELWRVVVDESFFSASSSEERKFHGFTIFTKTLERLTGPSSATALSALFTKNFMRSFINQLADPSRYLNKAALKCSRMLLQKAEAEPWCVPVVVTQLVTGNGMPNFDHVTKGKTVDKMICFADEAGLVEVMKVLRGVIVAPVAVAGTPTAEDSKVAEVRRQWAADQILSVVRNGKSVKSETWLREVVEMLATFGHFDVGEEMAVSISAVSQGMFRGRLLSCLSHLITVRGDGGETWPYRAVKTISNLQKEGKYQLAIEVDEVIAGALKGATKTLERIRKKRSASTKSPSKSANSSSQLSSFELLYSLVILQIYSGETDALGVLDELQLCYDKVVRPKSKKSAGEEDVDASEVMVEILLSFLSKPSVLLRKLAQQVFASFVDTITGRGLEATFGVLETKESLGGQQELFDREEEDDAEMERDLGDDDDELDSDVEVVDAEEMDLDDEEEDSESEDDDDDNNDDEDEASETEVSKLEAALSEALGAHKATDDNDSDSDMDDEAMLALDEHLVKIFKQRNQVSSGQKSKKQESKHAKETITNFKNRVLDLLDIFAKSPRARDEVTISSKMLIPLLKCIRTTGNKQVAERAAAVIRNYANTLRGKEADVPLERDEDKEGLWELLGEIHKEAARDGGVGRDKHKAACSQVSLLVMKVLIASGGMKEEDVERAVRVYADSLTKWLTERSWRVQSGLFTDLVNWAASASKRVQNEGK